jgi:hypothetical protein
MSVDREFGQQQALLIVKFDLTFSPRKSHLTCISGNSEGNNNLGRRHYGGLVAAVVAITPRTLQPA